LEPRVILSFTLPASRAVTLHLLAAQYADEIVAIEPSEDVPVSLPPKPEPLTIDGFGLTRSDYEELCAMAGKPVMYDEMKLAGVLGCREDLRLEVIRRGTENRRANRRRMKELKTWEYDAYRARRKTAKAKAKTAKARIVTTSKAVEFFFNIGLSTFEKRVKGLGQQIDEVGESRDAGARPVVVSDAKTRRHIKAGAKNGAERPRHRA
jgi:hypothetical protein